MPRLYLHRVKLVEKDGEKKLERVPERPKKSNMDVRYRIGIKVTDDTHAKAYGWSTGGYNLPCNQGPEGTVYAPNGFKKGKLAFVDIEDPLLGEEAAASLDKFLANLPLSQDSSGIDELPAFQEARRKAELAIDIARLQGFALMGEIEYDLLGM